MRPLGFMIVVYSEMNRSDEVIDCAERAMRIAQEHYPEAHCRTLQQWYNLADVYGNLKRYESRFEVLKRIRELIEESDSSDADMHKRVPEDIAD